MFNAIKQDIQNIMVRDPAARNTWEIITCYPGFHAIIMHRVSHWCWQHQLKWLGRFISYLTRIVTGIEIHPAATIGRRVFIDHGFGVVIGETASVGDDCTIYQGVTLGGTSLHKGEKRHPTLEHNVIIGAGTQILGAITIGHGAKVGSNAVVIKNVPAGATAVGNPARIIIKTQNDTNPNIDKVSDDQSFSAYGVTQNVDNAITTTLHSLINNAAAQEKKIETLLNALKNANISCNDLPKSNTFNPDQLNKMVD